MYRIIKILVFLLVIFIGPVIGYYIGFFDGTNKAFFLKSSTTALGNIHTLRYLERNELGRVKSMLNLSLEENMATMKDICKNRNKISKIPHRVMLFRELFNSTNEFLDMEGTLKVIEERASIKKGK